MDSDLKIHKIPLSDIHMNEEFNCRGKIAPIDVVSLAKDISMRGLISPVIITPYSEKKHKELGFQYLLIAGYRRFIAHRINDKLNIDCIIREELENEAEARFFNLSENLQREDLNILQEALALKKLKELGITESEAAERLTQSRGWVQIRYMLLKLPPDIQQEVAAGFLTQTDIRDIYSIYRKGNTKAAYDAVRKLKDAKLKGIKINVNKTRKSLAAKAKRNRHEIFEMMEHIRISIGHNLGTRCLAWAAGEISNLELYQSIKEDYENYKIPKLED
jgi:ParB family chromosome partitioning protein